MKLNIRSAFVLLLGCFSGFLSAQNTARPVIYPTDTLTIPMAVSLPVIDGKGTDSCWQQCSWQPINQTWIPYGASVDSADFFGRYKILWSPKTNLLYFLAETTDDSFVDGYVYDPDPKKGNSYPDYDILEVFLDEDHSGGPHVFNGKGADTLEWGSNAYNAFSYHILISEPLENQIVHSKVVCDIDGLNWNSYIEPDYANHLPDFAVTKKQTTYTWEFSLQVHNQNFQPKNQDASLVPLVAGKIMGISLAYCDNDSKTETPKTRDNFFGSVYVPAERYNDHWKNSSDYRVVKLTAR